MYTPKRTKALAKEGGEMRHKAAAPLALGCVCFISCGSIVSCGGVFFRLLFLTLCIYTEPYVGINLLDRIRPFHDPFLTIVCSPPLSSHSGAALPSRKNHCPSGAASIPSAWDLGHRR